MRAASNLKSGISLLTIGAAFASSAMPALAQDTADGTSADDGDVIIVTGRLRGDESVQDVPLAVTVVSVEQLGTQGALNIEDIETLAPNVIIDPVGAGPGGGAISMRGVSFEDIEKSFEPTVGVVIDGVFLGTNTGQLTNAFDFEQVEVLRGPQGTLFGRNTIGGVINIRRSRPTKEFGIKAEATLGKYGREEYNAVLNVGDGDMFGLKLWGYDRTFDGFYDNVTLGIDAGSSSNTNIGGTLLFEPTPDLEILLTVEHSKIGGDPAVASVSQNTDLICILFANPNPAPPATFNLIPEQCNRDLKDDLYTVFGQFLGDIDFSEESYSAQINYSFGDLKLTSITALKDSDERQTQDFDATSIPFFQTDRAQDYRQFSQELRLAGDFTDSISGVLGFFYFENEYQLDSTTILPGGVSSSNGTDHQTTSYAFFADFDVALTERLRLSVGGRYSIDEKEYRRFVLNGIDLTNEDEWKEFTPRVSLDYDVSDDVMVYASYARGYRSGGFNGRGISPTSVQTSFQPETVDSYELGAKTTFLGGAGIFNIAAFYAQYDDKQEEVVQATPPGSPNPQETVTRNAASATIKGLEADLRVELFDDFTITGSLGLLDADYDNFFIDLNLNGLQDPGEDASTREMRRTPDVTFSVAADYKIPVSNSSELALNARLSTSSSYQTTIVAAPGDFGSNDPRGVHPSTTDLSAAATYRFDLSDQASAYLRVFGRNLLDERGISSTLPVAGLFTFAGAIPPRQYGVTLGFEF
ncbi:TonB-dependent receptor [Altererythrobacter arenosus]|uniref:TonB-dependent receptor n=1 Tax=Altererythrobacter arenosus TaxID=3032592 RepID=A0ABY8FRS1_9SPHN|nr:TonB-dependent receptor [Altererythrobacter sp. CAU 1644]WFL77714.1 TonB-dependent receptor [Altererythrobacter sp. CAU 1644]